MAFDMYHVCWRQLKRACVINELIQLHIANLIFSINITDKNTGKHIIILVYQNELLLMKITLIYRLAVVYNVLVFYIAWKFHCCICFRNLNSYPLTFSMF